MLEQIFHILGITYISISLLFLIFLMIMTFVIFLKIKTYNQKVQNNKWKSVLPALMLVVPFIVKLISKNKKK